MLVLTQNLLLDRCPHCSVANPNLFVQHKLNTNDHAGRSKRTWHIYTCSKCGGVVSACSRHDNNQVIDYFPRGTSVNQDIPERPRIYLQQALESMHAPAGAVMLAASAVDSMLKLKGYESGSLYARIEQAAETHLITQDMAKWAHEVRLDANDQRHSDTSAPLPSTEDASGSIGFAMALAEILFVLPSKVKRGIGEAKDSV